MRRERARIEFPYGDLFDAVDVANKVHEVGEGCSTEQLAVRFGESIDSPKFRLRLSTARIFGLVRNRRGRLHLTDLGWDIVQPGTERRALVDAFLSVELYGALYQRHQDQPLPPKDDLEAEMVTLGVPPKQADKARQAFERSAKQAKFLRRDRSQFAKPVLPRPLTAVTSDADEALLSAEPVPGSTQGGVYLMVQGLLKELPRVGAEWPVPERVKWLRTAAQIFSLAYKGEDMEITILNRWPKIGRQAQTRLDPISDRDFRGDTTTPDQYGGWQEYCRLLQTGDPSVTPPVLPQGPKDEQSAGDQEEHTNRPDNP
jgi:hypothetical protein